MTKLLKSNGKHKAIKIDASFRAPFFISLVTGFRSHTYYPKDIVRLAEYDEDNFRSAGNAAAWAIAGGILTGGIGLIAGAAFGGRKRSTGIYLAEFNDGTQVAFEENKTRIIKLLKRHIVASDINMQMD